MNQADTCTCNCANGFFGTTCNTYDCNAGLTDSIECTGIDCTLTGQISIKYDNFFLLL